MERPEPLLRSLDALDESHGGSVKSTSNRSTADLDTTVWVGEIVQQLESGPDECGLALEGLNEVEASSQLAIVAALAAYRDRPAVRTLLRLLWSGCDPSLRATVRRALSDEAECTDKALDQLDVERSEGIVHVKADDAPAPAEPGVPAPTDLVKSPNPLVGGIHRSVVTAVDGDGRATIVISGGDGSRWCTAAFRCDLLRGIIEATGEVALEPPSTANLVDRWIDRFGPSNGYILDAHELAVGLLGGSLRISGAELSERVRILLGSLLGSAELPNRLPPFEPSTQGVIPAEEMPARAELVLDACPSWLDRSPLTIELATEISLRGDRAVPDSVRDSGAYRFLFEHRLSGRLELYSRMLLWMAWLWHATGHAELVNSAHALAEQLADEQYAVPSHPFIVVLTTLSLRAAQSAIQERTGCDSLEASA